MEETAKTAGLTTLCLFCSVKVSENNSELYRFHLRKTHNLDIEETISETFNGKYFPQSGQRRHSFLLKSVSDVDDPI